MSLPSHFIDEMVVIKDADLKKNDHQSGEKVIFSSNQAPKRPPDPPRTRSERFQIQKFNNMSRKGSILTH